MRHRVKGRKLGRNASHRKAMFRNMACSLIRSVRVDEDDKERPKVPGRIVTTLPKAKELRPFVEKLVTIGRKVAVIEKKASELATDAARNSDAWRAWRESDRWNEWNQAVAPAVALRRRAFAALRDNEAVDVLCDELAERFADRAGGYTRVVRLPEVRLGDAGQKALIEFVGERDRERIVRKHAPAVVDDEEMPAASQQPAEEPPAAESETGAGDEPEKKPE
jgi:large subunit ribosomal protein L17